MYTLNINVMSIENSKYIKEPMVTPKWLFRIEIEMSRITNYPSSLIELLSYYWTHVKLRSNVISVNIYSFPLLWIELLEWIES